jgi:CO dehydrogenase maturation factor
MEAGVEHLGRATARGVDMLLAVVEPSRRSVETAKQVERLAGEIGLNKIRFVGNKIASPENEKFVLDAFPPGAVLGTIPYSETLRRSERSGRPVLEGMDEALLARFEGLLKAVETA